MPLVELVGAVQMLLVEEQRILSREQPRAGRLADRVAHGVAEDRRDREQQAEQLDVEHAGRRREQARGDDQRIAGQKEADEQPVSAKMIAVSPT